MAAIPGQRADPCVRCEWSDKPGFWDPLAVVQVCIPVMAKEVYPRVNAIHAERTTVLNPQIHHSPKNLCKGISMYLEAWQPTEGIDKAIQRYIYYPCKAELIDCVQNKPERALAAILTYFKFRGPFFTWIMRNGDDGVAAGRCMPSATQDFLTHLPDLDFSAAVYIGRHLNYLLNVAYGHNIHYMRNTVAKVWGPLFVGVECEHVTYPGKRLFETEKIRLATELFARMLDTVPWKVLSPFEGVNRNIQQDKHSRLIRYENVVGQYIQDQLKEPEFRGYNIGDMMHNDAMQKAEQVDAQKRANPCSTTWSTSRPFMKSSEVCAAVTGSCEAEKSRMERCVLPPRPDTAFPPDKCELIYGQQNSRDQII